jgi:putative membrane protein
MNPHYSCRHHRSYFCRMAVFVSGGVAVTSFSEAKLQPPGFSSVVATAAMDPVATDALRANERTFLRRAVEASQQHFRLAQLAVGRATSVDLRGFGQQFVIDHRELSQSLEALVRRKGVALPPPTEGPVDQFKRLAEIPAPQFDREFVLVMSASSDALVRLFETTVAEARDADIRDFAGSFLPALRFQSNELRTLKLALD